MAHDPQVLCDHEHIRYRCDQCGKIVSDEYAEAVSEQDADYRGRQLSERAVVGGILLFLLAIVFTIWGIGGAFRIFFTAWAVWFAYSTWWVYIWRPSS